MQYTIKSFITFSLLFTLSFLSACGSSESSDHNNAIDANLTSSEEVNDNNNTTVLEENILENNLINAEIIEEINASTVLEHIKNTIYSNATNAFGYQTIKITYNTKSQNNENVVASGLLVIPISENKETLSPSIISENHETIFTNADAPTNQEIKNDIPDIKIASLMSGHAGFITVMSDYIGYGNSNTNYHPYILKKASARDSIDMLRASIKYLEDTNIKFNSEVYISGYSQGAYTAMALAQYIEQNPSYQINLKALAAMAGPYLIKDFGDTILKSDATMPIPALPAYMTYSYSKAYENISLEEMILDSKESLFDSLFNGNYSSLGIHLRLLLLPGASTLGLYEADFIADYESSPDAHKLGLRFEENIVGNWEAKTKINLIHCSNDDVVPVNMTHDAKLLLESYGAHNVNKTIIDNVSAESSKGEFVHVNCKMPAYLKAVEWFSAIKNGDI